VLSGECCTWILPNGPESTEEKELEHSLPLCSPRSSLSRMRGSKVNSKEDTVSKILIIADQFCLHISTDQEPYCLCQAHRAVGIGKASLCQMKLPLSGPQCGSRFTFCCYIAIQQFYICLQMVALPFVSTKDSSFLSLSPDSQSSSVAWCLTSIALSQANREWL
jgi:hypothetical protein